MFNPSVVKNPHNFKPLILNGKQHFIA
jgi:hypothetical protein